MSLKIRMKIFRFKGTSMLPTLKHGDVLSIGSLEKDPLRSGDMAVFKKNNTTICHRVIFKLKIGKMAYFLEKGDNVLSARLLKKRNILGKVKKIYRGKDVFYPSLKRSHGVYLFVFHCVLAPLVRARRIFFKKIHISALPRYECLYGSLLRTLNATTLISQRKEERK